VHGADQHRKRPGAHRGHYRNERDLSGPVQDRRQVHLLRGGLGRDFNHAQASLRAYADGQYSLCHQQPSAGRKGL